MIWQLVVKVLSFLVRNCLSLVLAVGIDVLVFYLLAGA